MIPMLLGEKEINQEEENLLGMKPQPKQPAFREHLKMRRFVHYKVQRGGKHRSRQQLK